MINGLVFATQPIFKTARAWSSQHMRFFRGCGAIVALLCLFSFPASAVANRCVEFEPVNLNIVIDVSGSMSGLIDGTSKYTLAKRAALEIFDAIQASGNLRRAGGVGFPLSSASFSLPMTSDSGLLRSELASTVSPDGGVSLMYVEIMIAANHMRDFRSDGSGILVVLTDAEDSGTDAAVAAAASALRGNGAWNFLVFMGSGSSPRVLAARDRLRNLATGSGSEFRYFTSGITATAIADIAIASACRNWSPNASVRVSPAVVDLDLLTGSIDFIASASDDITPAAILEYSWYLTPPGMAESFWTRGSGSSGALISAPVSEFRQLGPWGVRVEVDDGSGGVTPATATFSTTGTAPRVELFGGGPIEVLGELSVGNRHNTDARGRPQTSTLQVTSAPIGTSQVIPAEGWPDFSRTWMTNETDITHLSDHEPLGAAWQFLLTTRTASGLVQVDRIDVQVLNQAPAGAITGASETIAAGEAIRLESTHTDPDSGAMTWSWDIIQAPDGTVPGAMPRIGAGTDSVFSLSSEEAIPGSWKFRLTATDNEGEPAPAEGLTISTLVDARPTANINADTEILSLSEELFLDGRESIDPDSPCDPPESCHTSIEGPAEASLGIVRWVWTVKDMPPQYASEFPRHGVDDIFGVRADDSTVTLPAGSLLPGEWTFQLEIEDGEGHIVSDSHRVTVIDEGGEPVALVSPPERHFLNALGFVAGPVAISGRDSYDPDDRRLGIADVLAFQWDMLSEPPDGESCLPPPAERNGPDLVIVERDRLVPPECRGLYRIQLTVTDDDVPSPRSASVEAAVQIGNCSGVCIDYPSAAIPIFIPNSQAINVPIYYQVDPALLAGPAYAGGLLARLEIFPGLDLSSAIFSTEEPIFESDVHESSLGFIWTSPNVGYSPRAGTYSIQLTLIDPASGLAVTGDLEENAIAIAGNGEIVDCGDIWNYGFPDLREEDAYPCIEYQKPADVSTAPYRIYFPPDWDVNDRRVQDYLGWASTGLFDSLATYSRHGGLGQVALVFSNRYSPSPDPKPISARVIGGIKQAAEPCMIIVYPRGYSWGHEDFQWVIAHETGHCFQNERISDFRPSSSWWKEGMATYFGNLVYPDANTEFLVVPRTDGGPLLPPERPLFDPEVPIYLQSYPSAIFFQSLANDPVIGLDRVISLITPLGRAPGIDDPLSVFAAVPGMYDAWERFGQQLADGRVADTERRYWPYRDPGDRMMISGPSISWDLDAPFVADGAFAAIIPASRFAVRNVRLEFAPGWIYDVALFGTGARARRSASPVDRARPWGELRSPITPGCAGDGASSSNWNLIISVDPADAAPHQTRIVIGARRDPMCSP